MNHHTQQLVDQTGLFAGLAAPEREALAAGARVREVGKGEFVFHHGAPSTSVFVVCSGAIRVHRETPEGKEITLQMILRGGTVGDHEMFENKGVYQCSASASEDSVLLEYPLSWMRARLQSSPELAMNMMAAIAHTNTRMAIEKEHLITLKTPQRVGCFLMRLCDLHQLNPRQFTLPYSKATIASKLGMEPESFSRALAKLKEVGVDISGNEVSIRDIIALDAYICGSCSISEDCETCQHLHHTTT